MDTRAAKWWIRFSWGHKRARVIRAHICGAFARGGSLLSLCPLALQPSRQSPFNLIGSMFYPKRPGLLEVTLLMPRGHETPGLQFHQPPGALPCRAPWPAGSPGLWQQVGGGSPSLQRLTDHKGASEWLCPQHSAPPIRGRSQHRH